MKILKRFLLILIPIVILFIIIYFSKYLNRTIYNDETAAGNTPGNLFNGGLYSELNDKIFFSNLSDDGTLYQMDLNLGNFKKVYSDKAGYINASEHYLFYVRMNYAKDNSVSSVFTFKSKGIYRINHNGNGIKMLYDDPSGLMNMYGNNIFYQHYNKNEGLTFYSVSIDGKKEKMISKDPIIPISIKNNTLYYSGTKDDHNIYKMNLTSGRSELLYTGNTYAPIPCGDYLYFMSVDNNYGIYRINADGSDPVPVVADRVSTYNITSDNKYLYYQVDDTQNNGVSMLNLQTGEATALMEGNFKQINIAGGYVFFMDLNETITHYIPVGETNGVSTFNPPNLNK